MAVSNAIKFFIRGEDKSKAAFKGVNRSISNLSKKLFNLKTAMLGALGVAGLGAMASNILKTGDKMHKLSIRLGATTEALSQLKYAAGLSGVEFNALTMGMQRMVRRVAEAANGTGEAKDALHELGLDAQQLMQLEPEEQFKAVADAMLNVNEQADKVRLAMKIFDAEGVQLIQLMADGAAGINAMMQEADELGNTLSGKDAEAIAQFNDAMSKVKDILMNVARDVMLEFLPVIEDLLYDFSEWWKINKDIIAMNVADWWATITDKVKELWPEVKRIVGVFWDVVEVVTAVINKFTDFSSSFNGLFSALGAMSSFRKAYNAMGAEEPAPMGEAESIAAAGGGDTSLTDDEIWAENAMQRGSTVVINQQVSRSDVTAIINETARQQGRI
jgi:uncharacterized ferredoxin-like protein